MKEGHFFSSVVKTPIFWLLFKISGFRWHGSKRACRFEPLRKVTANFRGEMDVKNSFSVLFANTDT